MRPVTLPHYGTSTRNSVDARAFTLAELAAGLMLASSVTEQADRQARIQEAEATFEPIPFDAAALKIWTSGCGSSRHRPNSSVTH